MGGSEHATITSDGRVTVPKRIRDELGLEAGTKLEFSIETDGTIRVRPREAPIERLRAVKERLATQRTDVTELRNEAKHAWRSRFDRTDRRS